MVVGTMLPCYFETPVMFWPPAFTTRMSNGDERGNRSGGVGGNAEWQTKRALKTKPGLISRNFEG